ncbi:hypothetical protein [Phenylobacterium deserti]|uniref:Lipoprotein n=1 Tax=Phenylobacterium deserti TaxID=1914756 RepID=A0A328APM0_9CAUL|nr:hypothetical protein [Phenylobacterium deserti]RAK56953.1 hypothetical protein DJ018_03010 [Phenylobacterium deserti]
MKTGSLGAAAALLAGACLLVACDKSPQTADGATAPGDHGVATATGNGTIAATGSAHQGAENATPSGHSVQDGMTVSQDGAAASAPPGGVAPGGAVGVQNPSAAQ